jgi:cyclic pyranopterin phosphate synthase
MRRSCTKGIALSTPVALSAQRRESAYNEDVDPLRLNLPIVRPAPSAEAHGWRSGLRVVGPARAQGLFDRFGRAHTYLRISVTERCNLRCQYCMPEEGVQLLPRDHLLSYEEIERLSALFVRLGVRKIRLTGGEPLVRRDFDKLVERLGLLKNAPEGQPRLERLLLTTNGILLEEKLPSLKAAGIDGVNLSLDTLRPERFRELTKREGGEQVASAVRAAARAGLRSVKMNAVIMRGVNDDEVVDLARAFARELPIDVRYIEYMPFEGNGWDDHRLFPAADLRAALERELTLTPIGMDDGGAGVARIYAATDRDGTPFRGRVGIISSMSEPFCDTCSRLRLTADGHLRWCLFDEREVDLRGPMRANATDADLIGLIESALGYKHPAHGTASELVWSQHAAGPEHARSMIRIGG